MSGRFWNIVIGTATVSMAWVGFLLVSLDGLRLLDRQPSDMAM
jgi:hypothetical protein